MRLIRFAGLFAVLAGCANGSSNESWVVLPATADTSAAVFTITGTVRHTEVEGGVYTIRSDDGTTYDPTNLPAAFQKDGLAVVAEARKQEAMAGIHQVGPIVTLVRIRNR